MKITLTDEQHKAVAEYMDDIANDPLMICETVEEYIWMRDILKFIKLLEVAK